MSSGVAIIGIDPTSTRTSTEGPLFTLGQRGGVVDATAGSGIKEYVYVQAAALMSAGLVCALTSAGVATALTLTNSAPGQAVGRRAGVAVSAIPASGYGWVQVYGVGSVSVLANAVLNTQLNTTATAGTADDDATASSEVLDGIVLNATNGGSTAVVAATLNYPFVGRTL